LLDKKWDFASDRVTENMTLYADLQVTPTLTVKVDGGTDLTFSGTPGDKKTRPSDKYAPQKDGYTFYDYYEDEACTVKFSWPYTFTSEDKTVYARFIEGENWKVVTTAQEFKNAIALNSSAKIYVDADLDFSETSWTYGLEFNGEINGNGHKVTGISCTYSASKNTQSDFGLFGVLKSNAYIHDWTIENAQATFTASFKSLEYKVALFAWKAEAGVKIENVTVSGTLAQGKMDDDIKKYSEIEMSQFIAIGENLATVTNCDYSGVVIDDGTTSDDATTGDGATTDDEAITSDDGTEN
jgi:hypothetical protein